MEQIYSNHPEKDGALPFQELVVEDNGNESWL